MQRSSSPKLKVWELEYQEALAVDRRGICGDAMGVECLSKLAQAAMFVRLDSFL